MTDALYASAKSRFEAAVARAYPVGSVPASPEYPYLAWSLSQDNPVGYSLDVVHGSQFQRVTWQAFGRTLESARAVDRAATAVWLDQTLTATGFRCDPATTQYGGLLGAGPIRDPDDNGVLSLTSSLTFTATEESS